MSFLPTSIPTKRLASSITSSDMTFQLDDIIGWDGVALTAADFGTQAYCVFRNSTRTQIEIMEFNPATIASTSITISKRGLDFTGDPTTEITANKLDWTSGDTFVDLGTDTPQLWQWLKDYIDSVAIAGAPNASTTVQGNVEIATQAQYTAKTAVGETGALLVAPNSIGPTIETTTGTTHSLVTVADQKVMVWAKGWIDDGTGTERTVELKYNGVTKDTTVVQGSGSSTNPAFALMYTETPGAGTQNITVTTTGGTLMNVVIMVLKF